MSKPPYFPLYPKDLLADDLVLAMCTESFGAYVRLLCAAWVATPPATIPANDDVIARLAGLTPHRWSELKAGVLAPWRPTSDGRLVQPRLLDEYLKADRKIRANKANGKRGGRPRGERKKTQRFSDRLANGNPTPTQSESESDTLTTTALPADKPPDAVADPPPKPKPKPARKPRPPHWSEPYGSRLKDLDGAPKDGPWSFLAMLARKHTQNAVLGALRAGDEIGYANWKHAAGWLTEAARNELNRINRLGGRDAGDRSVSVELQRKDAFDPSHRRQA